MKKIISIFVMVFGLVGFVFANDNMKIGTTIVAGADMDFNESNIGGDIAVNVSFFENDLNPSMPSFMTGKFFGEVDYMFFDKTNIVSLSLGYGLYNVTYASAEVLVGISYVVGDNKPSVIFGWRLSKTLFNFGRVHFGMRYILRNSKCDSSMNMGISIPILY